MKPEEIHLNDWQRWLMGEVPAEFLIEAIIRTVVVYLILMVAMRVFGKRMAAQMDRVEMAGMVTLAAAIGVPIQAPDRGLLPAVIIAIVVVWIGRIITRMAFRNQKFEKATHGNVGTIVLDGVMDVRQMLGVRVSREQVFGKLRTQGIKHLGEVRRLYLEASGGFSILRQDQPCPGLSVLPEWDTSFQETLQAQGGIAVCGQCGKRRPEEEEKIINCPNCENAEWQPATL
jgi:uncharacterized membrane protein YcaP (DUF421 family)